MASAWSAAAGNAVPQTFKAILCLERDAAVVVQKSLAEGFGLTVTEAMWKGRPVVASAAAAYPTRSTTGTRGS